MESPPDQRITPVPPQWFAEEVTIVQIEIRMLDQDETRSLTEDSG